MGETKKPTLILFIRHGQTETTGKILPGRAKGLSLSSEGLIQASKVAEQIRDSECKPSVLYMSPMERTKQTAAPIASILGLRKQINKGLNEADFGEWTGKELKDLRKLKEWRQVQDAPSTFRFPGGESFIEMQTRIVNAVEKMVNDHPGETLICVSHADMIKSVIAHSLGMHLDQFQRLVISPCSSSAVLFGNSKPTVLFVNNIGTHLPNLNVS